MGLWFSIKSDTHRMTRVHTSTSSACTSKSAGEVAWERCIYVCIYVFIYLRLICFSPAHSGVKTKQKAWSLVTPKQSYTPREQKKHQSCLFSLCRAVFLTLTLTATEHTKKERGIKSISERDNNQKEETHVSTDCLYSPLTLPNRSNQSPVRPSLS